MYWSNCFHSCRCTWGAYLFCCLWCIHSPFCVRCDQNKALFCETETAMKLTEAANDTQRQGNGCTGRSLTMQSLESCSMVKESTEKSLDRVCCVSGECFVSGLEQRQHGLSAIDQQCLWGATRQWGRGQWGWGHLPDTPIQQARPWSSAFYTLPG